LKSEKSGEKRPKASKARDRKAGFIFENILSEILCGMFVKELKASKSLGKVLEMSKPAGNAKR